MLLVFSPWWLNYISLNGLNRVFANTFCRNEGRFWCGFMTIVIV